MSGVTAEETLYKQPSERREYSMDFTNLLSTGETLSSPVVTHTTIDDTVSDLTIEAPSISGALVKFWISGGTNGLRYRVEVTVETSLGQILECDGILVVKDK